MTDKIDTSVAGTFQDRVLPWLHACFGPEIASDKIERNHRFLEESLELVQATGCLQAEAHQLVDYVYGREIGEPSKEVGGVMNTLAALCLAHGMDMHNAGEVELARVWTMVEKIRAKQAAKPKHSPLPMHVSETPNAPLQAITAERDALRAEVERLTAERECPANAASVLLKSRAKDADIHEAMVAHYGKRAADLSIYGVDLTSDSRNFSFKEGFKRMLRGYLRSLAALKGGDA